MTILVFSYSPIGFDTFNSSLLSTNHNSICKINILLFYRYTNIRYYGVLGCLPNNSWVNVAALRKSLFQALLLEPSTSWLDSPWFSCIWTWCHIFSTSSSSYWTARSETKIFASFLQCPLLYLPLLYLVLSTYVKWLWAFHQCFSNLCLDFSFIHTKRHIYLLYCVDIRSSLLSWKIHPPMSSSQSA